MTSVSLPSGGIKQSRKSRSEVSTLVRISVIRDVRFWMVRGSFRDMLQCVRINKTMTS